MDGTRELYRSPNGGRWLLVRDPANGRMLIRHEPNAPSGGQSSETDLGDFLSQGSRSPEHEALLRLIGTLVE